MTLGVRIRLIFIFPVFFFGMLDPWTFIRILSIIISCFGYILFRPLFKLSSVVYFTKIYSLPKKLLLMKGIYVKLTKIYQF